MALGRDLAEVGRGTASSANSAVGWIGSGTAVGGLVLAGVQRDPWPAAAGVFAALSVLLGWQCIQLVRKVRELNAEKLDRKAEHALFTAELQAEEQAVAAQAARDADRAAAIAARTEAPETFRVMLQRAVWAAPPLRQRLVALEPFSQAAAADPNSEWSLAVQAVEAWIHSVARAIRWNEGSVSVWHQMVRRFGDPPAPLHPKDEFVPTAIEIIDWITTLQDDYENA